jgi:hypothetical protein
VSGGVANLVHQRGHGQRPTSQHDLHGAVCAEDAPLPDLAASELVPNLGCWLPGLLVGSDGPAAEFGRPAQSADRCDGMGGRRERAARLCVVPCLAHRFVESSDGPPVASAHISGHELADTTQAHAPASASGLGASRRLRAAPGRPRAPDPVDRGVRRRGGSRIRRRRSPRRRCHRRRALRRRHALKSALARRSATASTSTRVRSPAIAAYDATIPSRSSARSPPSPGPRPIRRRCSSSAIRAHCARSSSARAAASRPGSGSSPAPCPRVSCAGRRP